MADASIVLPPGFRFHPTDEEIITHYLTPKAKNPSYVTAAIGEVDLKKFEPWDLLGMAVIGEGSYFFFPKDRKYPTGTRSNRATQAGYWKATGKDKEIFRGEGVLVGMKKTLVFCTGKAPKGVKTNWKMHEFRLAGKSHRYSQEGWVVSSVFYKGVGEKELMHGFERRNSFKEDLVLDTPIPALMDASNLNRVNFEKPGGSSSKNGKIEANDNLINKPSQYSSDISAPYIDQDSDRMEVLRAETNESVWQDIIGMGADWCLDISQVVQENEAGCSTDLGIFDNLSSTDLGMDYNIWNH